MLRNKIVCSLGIVGVGAFTAGFGIKFSWVWRFTYPNFFDGIITTIAGFILIGLGTYYAFSLWRGVECH